MSAVPNMLDETMFLSRGFMNRPDGSARHVRQLHRTCLWHWAAWKDDAFQERNSSYGYLTITAFEMPLCCPGPFMPSGFFFAHSKSCKRMGMALYSATTHGITIEVTPSFLEDQSDVARSDFVWAYQVVIHNQGQVTVQLVARTWTITDKNGVTHVVKGPGVVGEQPILHQGDSFTYSSGCPLNTPSGMMAGSYTMVDENGATFEAEIPAFSLDSPYDVRVLN
jgi:ApaG protein